MTVLFPIKNTKRLTVKINDQANVLGVQSLALAQGGYVVRSFKRFPYIVLHIPEDKSEVLAANNDVLEIFDDGEVHALEQQLPWGIDRIDAEIVHSKYGIKGFGVKIAVIDTGIDMNHPDLKIAGGKSFISPSYQDDNGHGTHVAGTIAALDNDQGVVGVAPEAQLYAVKVLNSGGSGYWSDIAAGIEWCIDNGIDIISMSLGGPTGDSLMQTAVTAAHQAGILLIAAAGNSGNSEGTGDTVSYPAKYPEVIAVAATTDTDTRAAFSSTGPDVELAAPGFGINSTFLGGTYKSLNGTSMAAPHISGLAALIKSFNPLMSNEEIRQKLIETAIDLGQTGRDPWFGYGLVNAPAAVEVPGPDTSHPQIFFKNPVQDEIVSGVVKVDILAQDLSGIADLRLFVNDVLTANWLFPPYVYYWDTSKLSIGPHNLAVEATDQAGNTGRQSINVIVGPAVSILEPVDGAVIKDDVPIRVSFGENAVVVNSELYVDGTLKDTKAPVNNYVEFIWNSREVVQSGASTHLLKVTAITADGLKTASVINLKIRNPVVKIVSPTTSSIVSDNSTVLAHATDGTGIAKVDYLVDGTLADIISAWPYRGNISSIDLAAGNHSLKCIAYGNNGQKAESQEVIIKKPAGITFLYPLDGDIIIGKCDISVKFSESVSRAELYINDKFFGSIFINGVGPAVWSLDTTAYPDLTPLNLRVNAFTSKDQVLCTNRIHVTVDNYSSQLPPTIAIISPAGGTELTQTLVDIVAEATDDAGISLVEFYLDDVSIGRTSAPPYQITHDFSLVPAGKHYIHAKAEDIHGNTSTSSKVAVAKPTTVIIDLPPDKSLVTSPVQEFKFSCNDAISGTVKLIIDGILAHSMELIAPVSGQVVIPYYWDISQYPSPSEHSILVEVTTALDGILSKGSCTVTVNSADTIPPTVNITASHSGTVEGTVILTAEAIDNTAIERVEFMLNGTPVPDQIFPLEYEWDSSRAKTGNYSFTARAVDISGNIAVSNVVNLSVPTKILMTEPVSNAHIVGEVNRFTSSFRDPVVGTVSLYIDGEYRASSTLIEPSSGPVSIAYYWDTSIYPGLSQHQITITAETVQDHILSSGTSTVYVDNRIDLNPPKIIISSSAYRIVAGESVTLRAEAYDDAGIKQVDFYLGDSPILTLEKPPFELKWEPVGLGAGRYYFYAKAYDYAGNSVSSNHVIIGSAAVGEIVSPSAAIPVSGVVNDFAASFSEPVSGYAYLYIDGELTAKNNIASASQSVSINYKWDTSLYENGTQHKITIKAYTYNGAVLSEANTLIQINN